MKTNTQPDGRRRTKARAPAARARGANGLGLKCAGLLWLSAAALLGAGTLPATDSNLQRVVPTNYLAPEEFTPLALGAAVQSLTNALGPSAASANDNQRIEAAFADNRSITMESLDDKHALAIGDRLSFRIAEDLEEPKSLVVMDSGELEVPYIGRFPAEKKTCKQLARQLKGALEKEYYYQATVLLAIDQMTKSRGKVYLVGPVRVPGPQDIPSDEILTLSKAIMRAGGFNDYADRHNVKVTRKAAGTIEGKKTLVVDVGQIFDKGKVELDLPLEPGDLILIPERLVRF